MRLDRIKWERVNETLERAQIGNVLITKDTNQGNDTYNIRLLGSDFITDRWLDLDTLAAQSVLYELFPPARHPIGTAD
jgi:hypothetical protein